MTMLFTSFFAVANECDLPSKNCLTWVNNQLKNTKPNTMNWYNLKLWQLDSLMTLKEFKLLRQELDELKRVLSHPPMFVSYLNIYRAKLLLIDGEKEQALTLIEKSVAELFSLNKSFHSPMRLVTIANLMLNLKRYEEALSLLKQIEQDYKGSRDSHLKLELYGNLGHSYRFLKQNEEALLNYQTSLDHAIDLQIEQQIATLYIHVARMHMVLGDAKKSEDNYLNAVFHAIQDARTATIINAKVYLASFYIEQKELSKAKSVVEDIDPNQIEAHQFKRWEVITEALKNFR
ncbi:MAG: tetratricopeptide (TPR) repeat protein [Psychrosphaera sp.]|jgi:tetratricopeptide (TPR) repeat protein